MTKCGISGCSSEAVGTVHYPKGSKLNVGVNTVKIRVPVDIFVCSRHLLSMAVEKWEYVVKETELPVLR